MPKKSMIEKISNINCLIAKILWYTPELQKKFESEIGGALAQMLVIAYLFPEKGSEAGEVSRG